ncbi:MAG: 2-C-methyl-D-erythritol 2,4-cyclodiphosphate synthase [Candidatus Atribacteria bacterium]|nr:2-C-methyl-D-erythritol 2,4-cyclodiphosphate synthase [Candidatus Atribacteria bacterium]
MMVWRVGIGYDIHQLVPNRKLVLGGVTIPFNRGLLGHSDGDVVCHAIMDALLGAAGLPDIGYYFPDQDPQYRGIRSLILLDKVSCLIQDEGWKISNVDTTLVGESPRVAPFVQQMKSFLSQTMNIPVTSIGIKATTNEQLDSIGRGEAICCLAVALLQRD